MDEFYNNYRIELLKLIFKELKNGNKDAIKNYVEELKELNKELFLDKQLVR